MKLRAITLALAVAAALSAQAAQAHRVTSHRTWKSSSLSRIHEPVGVYTVKTSQPARW
jgi:hypothetical protein